MKKGFTLIELLAVIVILAIIAVIAVPIVLNIINDSREASIEVSGENYAKAVELNIAKASLNNEFISDGAYDVLSNGNLCTAKASNGSCSKELQIDIKGTKPTAGTVVIEKGTLTAYSITILGKLVATPTAQMEIAKTKIKSYAKSLELAVSEYKTVNSTSPTTLEQVADYMSYIGSDVDCKTDIYEDGSIFLYACNINGVSTLEYTYGTVQLPSNVGEYVNYVATGTEYTGAWRILGVENGHVLLISDSIGTLTLQGREGYNNAITLLDGLAANYAGGTKAVSARSIRVEDINKITGFNPYKTGNGEVWRKGQTGEYGNVVTYSYKDGIIAYKGTNGVEGAVEKYTSYEDFDGTKISSVNPTKTVQYTSTYYFYYFHTLIGDNTLTENSVGLKPNSAAFKMLYSDSGYWLANQNILTSSSRTSWQIRRVMTGSVDSSTLYHSFDPDHETVYSQEVRAVVTLDESANLVYDQANSIWNIE